jgi:hypothetical protein
MSMRTRSKVHAPARRRGNSIDHRSRVATSPPDAVDVAAPGVTMNPRAHPADEGRVERRAVVEPVLDANIPGAVCAVSRSGAASSTTLTGGPKGVTPLTP